MELDTTLCSFHELMALSLGYWKIDCFVNHRLIYTYLVASYKDMCKLVYGLQNNQFFNSQVTGPLIHESYTKSYPIPYRYGFYTFADKNRINGKPSNIASNILIIYKKVKTILSHCLNLLFCFIINTYIKLLIAHLIRNTHLIIRIG